MAKTKTTYYYKEYELETQKLNQLSENSFQVLLKFNEINRNNIGNVLFVKALFNNLGNQVFDIEVKSSIFDRGSNSQNGVFNLKLPILDKDKANPFLLMAKVFNSVQTTNLSTTLAKYSKLQSNTFSMKLFGKNSASTTTSKIFKIIGLESIANSSDGVNYTLKGATTIKSGESLTIPTGKSLLINYPFTNYGEFNIGTESNNLESKIAKDTSTYNCTAVIISTQQDYGNTTIYGGNCMEIKSGGNYQLTSTSSPPPSFTIDDGGTLYIDEGGIFIQENYSNNTFTNSGTIDNSETFEANNLFTNNNSGIIINNQGASMSNYKTSNFGQIYNSGTMTDSDNITCYEYKQNSTYGCYTDNTGSYSATDCSECS